MDRDTVRALLHRVADGTEDAERALAALVAGPLGGAPGRSGVEDLGFARLDTHRALRTGDPEVVYGAGKTPDQTVALLRALERQPGGRAGLATRLTDEALDAVAAAFPAARLDRTARCAAVGPPLARRGRVLVVTAGTSDEPVAREAAFVAGEFGCDVELQRDLGVAGLHRLLGARAALDAADCLIVVAGMDGALPSVVAGLVTAPVLAVPTSVGYGSAFGGIAPLLTMLNSCGPGVMVSNIDNGFGAAVAAARMVRRTAAAPADPAAPADGPGPVRG
ncbi:1-(5-phosphoribosyl)-5-amino-4-imidazole-carboxylate carboxylase [Kitasatospora phosalacinea]|uniref:1-(5-phosphoribosyl)-5-amino-4-imidazole-carboxylate carboxylase n=1 Tax=Kitasatospora phosalacinea TaxID=2065 RepID=A0A9W6QD52_9ACTN|nr:nickel pincer cofactor biosynthesis protein LarB [Kitasatospora phosalacinea]GLW73256.1 1-(5-phosphoribosyl)-5-amino-4-imidazole-carboxylate carboxylase [Kitasatospora phosalacinea]